MKIAKWFGWILGILGAVLMLASAGLILMSLKAQPRVEALPPEAQAHTEALLAQIAAGDFAAASELLYGQPELGAQGHPKDSFGMLVWDAYLQSISYEFQGECYMDGAQLRRDVTITALDIPSVTENLRTRAHALMTQRVEAATEMSQLYDDSGEFRPELVSAVLHDALSQALQEDARTASWTVQLTLIRENDQWWAVPSPALWKALTGNLA